MKKFFQAKLYSSTGTYKNTFIDFGFSGFSSAINSGLTDLTLTLPKKFDDYGDIDLGDEVQIYVYDGEAINGLKIYSGEVNQINSEASSEEIVEILCTGYIFQLSLDLLEDAGTVYFKWLATDPSTIITDILDYYKAESAVDKITYTASTVSATGKSEGLEIYCSSPLEAINVAKDLADFDWFWYIDADNVFYFKEISTTPDHYFTFGKDVAEIKFKNDIRELRNGILFSNGLDVDDPEVVFDLDENSASIASYGRRVEFKRDDRFKLSTGSHDEYNSRFLNSFKDPIKSVRMKIIDSNLAGGYDIESIKVGDTCKVLNISSNAVLSSNMLITNIDYAIDYVVLDVVDTEQYVNRLIYEGKQTMRSYEFSDHLPKTYS